MTTELDPLGKHLAAQLKLNATTPAQPRAEVTGSRIYSVRLDVSDSANYAWSGTLEAPGYGFQVVKGADAIWQQFQRSDSGSKDTSMQGPWLTVTPGLGGSGSQSDPDSPTAFSTATGELRDGKTFGCRFDRLTIELQGATAPIAGSEAPVVWIRVYGRDYHPVPVESNQTLETGVCDVFAGKTITTATSTETTVYDDRNGFALPADARGTSPGKGDRAPHSSMLEGDGLGLDFRRGWHGTKKRRLAGHVFFNYTAAHVYTVHFYAGYDSSATWLPFHTIQKTGPNYTTGPLGDRSVIHFTSDGTIGGRPLIVPANLRITFEHDHSGDLSGVWFLSFFPS